MSPMSTVSRRSVVTALAALPAVAALAPSSALAATKPGPTKRPSPRPASSSTLAPGSHGSAVTSLQNSLNRLGYWCGTADGSYGQLTQQAVYAVQKANGLSRDGVAGPKTLAAIRSGKRPSLASHGDGIEIHLGSQLLLVIRGGRVETILNTSTAGGQLFIYHGRRMRAVTPRGSFHVYQSGPAGWQNGRLGPMWRPYFFNGEIAIHGSSSIPSEPVSHGCCRVSVSAQNMLISSGRLRQGTSVRVVN